MSHEGEPSVDIITATIAATTDHRYAVRLRWHSEPHAPVELLHLVCLYYAKMLFICDPDDPEWTLSSKMFQQMISRVLSRWSGSTTDVLAAAGVDDVARIRKRLWFPSQRFVAVTHPLRGDGRGIQTQIPKPATAQHVGFSILVLLQHVLRADPLDAISQLLRAALQGMQNAYGAGADPLSPDALVSVPARAVAAASR